MVNGFRSRPFLSLPVKISKKAYQAAMISRNVPAKINIYRLDIISVIINLLYGGPFLGLRVKIS